MTTAPPLTWGHQTDARRDIDDYSPEWPDFWSFVSSRRDDGSTYLVTVDDDGIPDTEWTVGEWRAVVATVAGRLSSQYGVGPGDSFATLCGNSAHALAMAFAVWSLGACLVPLDPTEPDDRHAAVLAAAGARWVGVDGDQELAARTGRHAAVDPVVVDDLLRTRERPAAGAVELDAPRGRLDAPSLRIHTSGTTGEPKAVVLSMRSILVNCAAMERAFQWGAGTRVLTVLPIQHVNGLLINSFLPWFVGGSTVLTRRFRTSTFWTAVAETGATTSSLVPTVLEFLLTEAPPSPRTTSLQEVISGSGPLRADTADRFERLFGVPVRQLYGLSETSAVLTVTPVRPVGGLEPIFRESVGPAVAHAEVDVFDETDRSCEEGVTGEIVARGGMLMGGYAANEPANEAAFRNGWFRTGDRGEWRLGPDGQKWFFVGGRLRESILRGGLTIVPHLVDAVVESHPGVQRAAAFPFPNRWYGEEVAVLVVPRSRLEADELLEWCAARLDRAHRPKVVFFAEELPVTRAGKLRRGVIAKSYSRPLAEYWETTFRTPSAGPTDDT